MENICVPKDLKEKQPGEYCRKNNIKRKTSNLRTMLTEKFELNLDILGSPLKGALISDVSYLSY